MLLTAALAASTTSASSEFAHKAPVAASAAAAAASSSSSSSSSSSPPSPSANVASLAASIPTGAREAVAEALIEWPWDEPGSQFTVRPADEEENEEEEEGKGDEGKQGKEEGDVEMNNIALSGSTQSAAEILLHSNMMSLHCKLSSWNCGVETSRSTGDLITCLFRSTHDTANRSRALDGHAPRSRSLCCDLRQAAGRAG